MNSADISGPWRMVSFAYHHVDVFTRKPYSGNSLAVFPDARDLSGSQMLAMTRELRHFESIFLEPSTDHPNTYRARVFDLVEEVGFAGHSLMGAASVLHDLKGRSMREVWSFTLKSKAVKVQTSRTKEGFSALLDQRPPRVSR